MTSAVGVGFIASGCKTHTNVASQPCPGCGPNQPTVATAAVPPPSPTQAFQPYDIVEQPAPKPYVAVKRHRYLHIAQHSGDTYLADPDGRYYHIARDERGHVYPAYYDTVTEQEYPLYYDSSRDRYYRVCRENDGYYMNFVDDDPGRYYRCDRQIDYTTYAPQPHDCPIINDGYTSYTYYDEPEYYRDPNRYRNHWHDNDWLSAVPLLIGAYFVLSNHERTNPAWYYGHDDHDHMRRWAYREDDHRAPVYYYNGGQRITQYVIVTPPPAAMVPMREWTHYQVAYGTHSAPGINWADYRAAHNDDWRQRAPLRGHGNQSLPYRRAAPVAPQRQVATAPQHRQAVSMRPEGLAGRRSPQLGAMRPRPAGQMADNRQTAARQPIRQQRHQGYPSPTGLPRHVATRPANPNRVSLAQRRAATQFAAHRSQTLNAPRQRTVVQSPRAPKIGSSATNVALRDKIRAKSQQTANVQRERIDAQRRQAARIQRERVDAQRRQAASIQRDQVDAQRRQAASIQRDQVDAQRRQAANVQRERIDAQRQQAVERRQAPMQRSLATEPRRATPVQRPLPPGGFQPRQFHRRVPTPQAEPQPARPIARKPRGEQRPNGRPPLQRP